MNGFSFISPDDYDYSKVRKRNHKFIKLCARCSEHGVARRNKSGLCSQCSREIYINSKYVYRNKVKK